MSRSLDKFFGERLARVPGGSCQLRSIYLQFLDSLDDPRERKVWPRWRFASEVRERGLSISRNLRVQQLEGWSLLPAKEAVAP
jgi:hypothetical protein